MKRSQLEAMLPPLTPQDLADLAAYRAALILSPVGIRLASTPTAILALSMA